MSHNNHFDGRRAVIALTCAAAIAGLAVCLTVLRTWNETGPLTPTSYAMATLMYIIAPTAFTFNHFNKHLKTEK